MKKKESAFTDVESIIKRNKLTIKKANKKKDRKQFNFKFPSFKVKDFFNNNFKFIKDCQVKIALIHHQLDWVSKIEKGIITSHLNKNYDTNSRRIFRNR